MKKNTSCTIKSAREYCLTFSCTFKTGLFSFFWTNEFTKKLTFAQLFLLVFGQASLYAQFVGLSNVRSNFGIDGDTNADLPQFPNITNSPVPLPSALATNDWFQTIYPKHGFGVIKQTDLIPVSPKYKDAVYGRDSYAIEANTEKSCFKCSGGKNSYNPSGWIIGPSGRDP